MSKKIYWFLLLIFLLFSKNVMAGLSVDPVTVEVVAPKGEEKTGVFKVKNTGTNDLKIRVSPEKWAGKDIDINTWLVLNPLELALSSNATGEISYKVTSPIYSSGELKCMVFFVADEVGEQKSSVGIRFGVPVYAIVGGTEKIEAEIQDVAVNYDYANKIINGTILVNNKSNIHIRPDIEIKIYSSRDRLVTNFNVPYGQPAQTEQIRPFMFQQPIVLNEGKYKLSAGVDYGKLYGLTDKVAAARRAFIIKIPKEEVKEDEKG